MQPERLNPGKRIGPYEIRERLGMGGMGEVFLAYDHRLDRQVAIKRIRPEAGTNPRNLERFRREARMAARLSHPAIVQIHDILQEDETDSIVMELVEGVSLRRMIDQGPLPVRRVLELARVLADGLEAAHREGIIHRDFKTENVLIPASGRPKIVDFGIAKRFLTDEGEDPLTADHAILGTCRAMSPEQACGETVDHRTDLFALGVLLYEALTGESPFMAENSLATMNRVIRHRQKPLREIDPAIPQELSDLVDRLLEKDPLRRLPNAGLVRREIDQLLLTFGEHAGTETVLEVPPSRASRSSLEPVRRAAKKALPYTAPTGTGERRRIAVWGLALAILIGAGIWVFSALRPPKPPLYVAVLAPEIGAGAGNGEFELLASGVRVALLQGLVSLRGISLQAFEEVDAASGSVKEIAKTVAADELVGTRLDCRSEVCHVSLTRHRGADGGVVWAESFDIPTDDSTMVASVVKSRILQGYSGQDLREGDEGPAVSKADLDLFLRLRRKFGARQDASLETILAGLRKIRERSPRYVEAFLLEAEVLRYRFWASRNPKDIDRALKLIDQAEEIAPDDPRPIFGLVDLALEARRLKMAENAVRRLEPLVPGDARLLERQALLLSAQGQGEKALELMRDAAKLQPSSRRLHNLAQMELRQGEMADARKTLEMLLQRSPNYSDGLLLLAQLETSNGDLNRAVELYERLIRISPGVAELTNLGMAYMFLGRYVESAEVCRRALDLQPNHPALVLNLADAYLLQGRAPEAEALYRRVVALIEAEPSPSDPQFLTIKAQALAHLGEGRQAVAALHEALKSAPDQGPVAFEVSLVYALLKEEDSALFHAERAVQLGIGARWFALPWFQPLSRRPEFQELLRKAPPGLG